MSSDLEEESFGNLTKIKMVASLSIVKSQGVEVSNVQLVRSDSFPPPKFCAIPKIVMKGDSMGMLSSIHKVATCVRLEK